MDKHSKQQRSKNMKAVKSKGSKIEKLLAKELWKRGLRYRKHIKKISGNPDFAFIGLKIAVFCDSEFWHGKDWAVKKHEIKSNKKFWHRKIEQNIARDIQINKELTADGWLVLRFWGKEILKSTKTCADKVEQAIDYRKELKKQAQKF